MNRIPAGPGRRLTGREREELLGWVRDGLDYAEISAKLAARGLVPVSRQAVHYHRERLRKGLAREPSCPTCGRPMPLRAG